MADCAAAGRKNEEFGEPIVAVVTLPGCEMTLEKLRERLGKLIADYTLPRELVIGEVPPSQPGKIFKHKICD
ncbi:AMP-binding enzyme [Rhodococcus sp. AQ5-07]|uniref:AMP-binding enzyme n=1 Tax=Rhodococcus sp. AQ5-07 TaxID=2054902 RepID=UPI001E48B613|nr:hypothetical protein [Rhodococcus sp. AQ5-07]